MIRKISDWFMTHRLPIIVMASVIVAVTTYMLVLPAFTLTFEKAKEQGGISVTSEESKSENSKESQAAATAEDGESESSAAASDEEPGKDSGADQSEDAADDQNKDDGAQTDNTDEKGEEAQEGQETDKEENDAEKEDKKGGKVVLYSILNDKEKVTVTCGEDAEVPEGSSLVVSELLKEDEAKEKQSGNDAAPKKSDKDEKATEADYTEITNKEYKQYISESEKALGWDKGSASNVRLLDIKIVDKDGNKVKIAAPVDVKIELIDRNTENDLKVVHFADVEYENKDGSSAADAANNNVKSRDYVVRSGSIVDADANAIKDIETSKGKVSFETDGFSVYVVVEHEGDEEIVTPRVEFHFIDPDYTESTESGVVTYTAPGYEFVNKNGDYQITQILKDGEGLEKITNPRNIIIENQDGTTTEKYFYGWYLVDGSSEGEQITYQWTEHPENIPFEKDIDISYDADTKKITWTIDEKTFEHDTDELGCAHVYLAPLYEDFHFVNFRMNSYNSEGQLKNSLLTRKMVVFGSDDEVEVRIGDVKCPSPDAKHLVFVGWQEYGKEPSDYYATVDSEGNEVNSEGHTDGYYITVENTGSESTYVYDLYPVFAEARWLHFNTGRSGNGSSYIGSEYLLTNDEGIGTSFDSLPTPTRPGYDFKGWYTAQDSDYNGTGTQLTDENGAFIDSAKGQTFDGGAYEITTDGKMYFYREMSTDGLTVYAKWEPHVVDYTVVYWLQNADNDNYTLIHYQTEQGVSGDMTTAGEIPTTSSVYTENKLRFTHLSDDQDPDTGGDQSDIQQQIIEGDGSTIVNIYYDRDVYKLRFDIGFARKTSNSGSTTTYSTMTPEEAASYSGTVYGVVDGNYIELTPDGNGGYTYAGTETIRNDYDGYRYKTTTGTTMPQYGVADDAVVELDVETGYASTNGYRYTPTTGNAGTQYGIYNNSIGRVYNRNGAWRILNNNNAQVYNGQRYTRDNGTAGTQYSGDVYYVVNNGFSTNGTGNNIYGYNGTYYFPISETTVYTYNGGTQYPNNADRYQRVANDDPDSSYSLGFIDGDMETVSKDSDGWYYNTEKPTDIPYSGNLYKQTTIQGTWQYSVSNLTSPNYQNNDTWDDFLTQHRYDLGTTDPFSPSEYTGTYTTTVGGTDYIVYYYDLTGKYGETIMDRYPGSQPKRVNGNNSYSFVGWLAQRDSYYNGRLATSIKGYFSTMTEDLILTGGTIPGYNQTIPNPNPDNYTAVTIDGDNTITHEHGITQEFRCRYTTLTNAKKYLYRVYLADPDTREFPVEPTDKFVITAGSGSNPNLQTPPTYKGYTLVDTKVLDRNGIEQIPTANNYSAYAIPELTEAGVGDGMIMQFKLMPNLWNISYKYAADNTEVGPSKEYYYDQSIANADVYTETAIANTPEGHEFAGWYENPDGIGNPFNFETTMPDGDIMLYAVYKPLRYRVKVDPNGAEIDHIDHTGATYDSSYHGVPYHIEPFNREAIDGERPADSGYNRSQATYINATYDETISEYTVSRNYVPISDAAAETYDGTIFYYINTQYKSTDGTGLPSDLRNAMYVTEDEIAEYYRFYSEWMDINLELMPENYIGTQKLSFQAWKQLYVSDQKYRKCNSKEHYEFLGWYKDDERMPYDFADPVKGPFTLTAKWRLDGGYTVQYHTDYILSDGTKVTATMPAWVDPQSGSTHLSYADGADTTVAKQPDDIIADGVPVEDDSIVFRGWRLVSVRMDQSGNPVYTPLEDNVYYDPDDKMVIQAATADTESVIHMQAVYEKKEGSYRRPEIANLTLDANGGFISLDGSTELTENTDLTDTWTGRQGVGTVAATVTTDQGNTELIEFGDIQSNEEVHLKNYATEGDGTKNYFVHPEGQLLLGFDNSPNEGDYVATYASDAVISVQRTDEEKIYAVWEPLVYITFVNDTGVGDVTFSLSSDDATALQVVNYKNGDYERVPLADLGSVTVKKGESITLAIPRGAEKDIKVSGTNTLGVGNMLTWDTEVTLDGHTYKDEEYSHTVDGNTHSHVLASSDEPVKNTKPFEFSETLITDPTGLIVTFKSIPNDYTIVLDDNYQGGGIQEYDFESDEVLRSAEPVGPKSTVLPNTSTRIGYEFIGWAYDPDATDPDYSTSNDWTINDLEYFFNEDEDHPSTTSDSGTVVQTLYAVWKASADAHIVKVYKEVPLPGNQNEEFTFTVSLTGVFTRSGRTYPVSGSDTFTLKHGGYLRIDSSNSTGSGTTKAFVQAIVQVFKPDGTEDTSQKKTVRWESSSNGAGSYNQTERVVVTETPETYYETEETRASQITEHPLYMGDSTDITTIPLTVDSNVVQFDTDAGGTVIYTNKRETQDIIVAKRLVSYTTAATQFAFKASYTLDGQTNDLGTFYVTSGSTNVLEDVPAGATLTITEEPDADTYEDSSYITSVESVKHAEDLDPADNVFKFVVEEEDAVTFTNTLKKYKIRMMKVNQNGEGGTVEAFFDLVSNTGVNESNLYASANNHGVFYENNGAYVGSYTLTETWVEDGYIGLASPVQISITGSGVTCEDKSVIVEGDAQTGYVIKVYNIETKEVTVSKELVDPLITQRQFNFTLSYNYKPQWITSTDPDDTITQEETFTLVPTTSNPASKTYTIPVGATVTVSEDAAALAAIYDTTVSLNGGTATTGTSKTIPMLAYDSTIAFTNTRKTAVIDVKKIVDDTDPTAAGTFPFTATLLNGNNPIPGYTVYHASGSGSDLVTDSNGKVSFGLAHNEYQELTVPVGAILVIGETADDYTVTTVSQKGAQDRDTAEKSFTLLVTEDDMITFTNTPSAVDVKLMKVGTDNTDQTHAQYVLGGAKFTVYEATGTDLDTKGDIVVVDGQQLTNLVSSDTTGQFWNGKLPIGTYIIEEDEAPDGYYRIPILVKMVVAKDAVSLYTIGPSSYTGHDYNEPVKQGDTWVITLINTKGVELPHTGGSGVTWIYFAGVMMVLMSGAALVIRRKITTR